MAGDSVMVADSTIVVDSTIAMVVSAAVDFMIGRFFRRHFGRRFGFGFYPYDDYAYDYPYGYGYNDAYYDNGSCYVVQRRVHTTHGWRLQPRQVCG